MNGVLCGYNCPVKVDVVFLVEEAIYLTLGCGEFYDGIIIIPLLDSAYCSIIINKGNSTCGRVSFY